MSNNRKTHNTQYVADFETLHKDTLYFQNLPEDKKDTRIIYWYAENRNNPNDAAEGVTGTGFYDWLMSLTKNTTVWFHNLAFDGTYIIPILERNGWQVVKMDLIDNQLNLTSGLTSEGKLKSKHFAVFVNGNKIYEIQMYHKRRVNGKIIATNINIRCSYVMLSSSVKALGKSLGIDKHLEGQNTKEFYIVEPEEDLDSMYAKNPDFVEYCKRDVKIVLDSLKNFVDAINELPTIKQYLERKSSSRYKREKYHALDKSVTIGGLSRVLMSKIYVPFYEHKNYENLFGHKDLLKIGYKTHKFIKSDKGSFYKGGFVQYNPEYLTNPNNKWVKDGIKIDVVSAYPYQMTFSLPYGEIMNFAEWEAFKAANKGVNWIHGVNYQEWLIVKVARSKPKPIAKYCCNITNFVKAYDEKKNKYRYNPNEQKNYTAYLSRQEWEELQHWSDFTYTDIQYFYQLSAPFLKGYAEEVIDMKTKFGKEGKGAFKQAIKILANSAYGSLGIRLLFDLLIQTTNPAYEFLKNHNPDDWVEVTDYKKKSGETKIKFKGDSFSKSYLDTKAIRITEPENEDKKYFNIACAALITSLQRVYIWSTIRKIGAQYFCYSDTDSIIFANFPPEKRKEIISMCGDQLGQWEIEKEYVKGFTVRKAKDYAVVYKDKEGKEHIESKSAGFSEDTELKELLASFFYDDGTEYMQDEIKIQGGSTTRVKYPSGIILADIDKINKKTSL